MKNEIHISGINELILDLTLVYTDLREGRIKRNDAKVLHGVASAILRAAVAKAIYNKNMDKNEVVPFLEN